MSNFSLLSQYDEQLLRLGMLAEKYFADDPNTCLIKLRQLGESLAQMLAARTGLYVSPEETQHDLLRRLQDGGEADSATLKFNKGARPAKNRNLAIAEWPSEGEIGEQNYHDEKRKLNPAIATRASLIFIGFQALNQPPAQVNHAQAAIKNVAT